MRAAIPCLALSLLLLTACQDKAAQSPPTTAQAGVDAARADAPAERPQTPEGAMPADGGLREVAPKIVLDTTPVDTQIVDAKLSDNSDGKLLTGQITDQFKTDDGVFMSIRTQGTADKYTLSSKWLAPNGDTLTEYSQIISTPGQADTIFSLSKPDGWAKGQYQVELSINGKKLRSVPFTVR